MAKETQTLGLRSLLISLILLLVLLSLGYKVFEHNTLQGLANLYAETVTKELSLIEESQNQADEAVKLFADILTDDQSPFEDILKKHGELQGKTSVLIGSGENYLSTVEKHKSKYQGLNWRARLLLGNRGGLIREFLKNQNKYYEVEVERSKDELVGAKLFLNIFEVLEDTDRLNNFNLKTQRNPETTYPQYFYEVAALEKYTRSDFKFKEEAKIKELYPYGYEYLDKNKNYMAAFYEVAKDFIAGDYESAAYKYSRLEQEVSELNIDTDRLFDEGKDRRINQAKSIVEAVSGKVRAIKEFQKANLGNYPFIGNINSWKEDLELCQLYSFRAGLFETVSKKYPEAETFDELLKELSTIPPKTDEVDALFDKSVLSFNNTEEALSIECADAEADKTYTFKITKY